MSEPDQEQILRRGRELLRQADDPDSVDVDRQLAAIDRMLMGIEDDRSPAMLELAAALREAKVVLLGRIGDPRAQRLAFEDLVARFKSGPELKPAVSAAWGVMLLIDVALSEREFDQAARRADELQALFEAQPDTQDLTWFGSLLLNACDSPMDARCDEPALRLCQAVAERLKSEQDPRRKVVATGASFSSSRALAHLDRQQEAQEALQRVIATSGETALTALDQAAARVARDESSRDLRISMWRIGVLLHLGQEDAARVVAERLNAQYKADGDALVRQTLADIQDMLAQP